MVQNFVTRDSVAQGDELELCDGEGRLCLARLAAASGGRQDVAVEALELPREVRRALTPELTPTLALTPPGRSIQCRGSKPTCTERKFIRIKMRTSTRIHDQHTQHLPTVNVVQRKQSARPQFLPCEAP